MSKAAWLLAGALTLETALAAQAPPASLDFEYYRTRVEPIFLKPREEAGPGGTCFVCHAHISGRFRLQPLAPGATSWTEPQSRRNLDSVARLIAPGDPMKSRLLLHPLALSAGGDPAHLGGKHWPSQDDPEWKVIADWVKLAPASAALPPPPALSFEVFRTQVQPILLAKRKRHARCYVCHAQGTGFRLQALPAGGATWDEAQSKLNFDAVQRLVVAGDPESSRLLMVPLAEEAGGDPFHPGGKHWESKKDREWRILEAWVRGSS